MSITTKRGDCGQTDLLGGLRVSKGDVRVECVGAVDELTAALGLARSLSKTPYVRENVEAIQRTLSALCAALAGSSAAVGEEDLALLETVTGRCMAQTGEWTGFVIPGADPASAALHLARTVARRAERAMVRVTEAGHPVDPQILCYVNRLSDALFALARLEEQERKD